MRRSTRVFSWSRASKSIESGVRQDALRPEDGAPHDTHLHLQSVTRRVRRALSVLTPDAMDDELWDDVDLAEESDGSGSDRSEQVGEEVDMDERVALLRAPILSICTALGGYEHVQRGERMELMYRVGDDCLECLRDLRRLWRQDDTDASRAIARVFAELGTLHNDLIPILLHCAGGGDKADKIALACTDLITALTWPIDWDAELHDMSRADGDGDENEQVLAKLVELQNAQITYKASILRVRAKEPRLAERTTLGCVLRHILVPALKPRAERTERDTGVLSMCLHLFRNLLAIRDPPLASSISTRNVSNAALHSVLVQQMDATHILDTLRMLASQADSKEFDTWAPIVADCVFHMYAGTDVAALASTGTKDTSPLATSLAEEATHKRSSLRMASARHSRFGTTIQFPANDGSLRVSHSPAALKESVASLDQRNRERMRRRISRRRPATERGAPPTHVAWTPGAHAVLAKFADAFVRDGIFSLLITTYLKDIHAERERVGDLDRARCKAMYMAAFFLEYGMAKRFPLELAGAWLEPWAFRLVRARTAIALESRAWLEFTNALRLWTTLLHLIDALAHGTDAQRSAADTLQHTLYYDGELLDTALHAMHAYSAQSFACLEAVIHFAYMMPRLLEKHAAHSEYMFVKRRTRSEESAERVFRFTSFQRAMANARMAHACTQYLLRCRDSAAPRTMLPRLAAIVYRLVVKASRADLFFSARVRGAWAHVMTNERAQLEQCHERAAHDLVRLYAILQKTYARLTEAQREAYEAGRRPQRVAELYVRSDLSHAEQIGVAVGLLAEAHKLTAVSWVRTALERASAERMALGDMDPMAPPPELYARFARHTLPSSSDGAQCAPLHLLCRLVELECDDAGWYVPPDVVPGTLARYARIVDQYLAEPLVIEGHTLADLVRTKRARPETHAAKRQRTDEKPMHVPALSDGSTSPSSSSPPPPPPAPAPAPAKQKQPSLPPASPDLFFLSDTEV